jgi:hypothetical protein
VVLLALAIGLFGVSCVSVTVGGDARYILPIGIFAYGVVRLTRGLDASRGPRDNRPFLLRRTLSAWILRRPNNSSERDSAEEPRDP